MTTAPFVRRPSEAAAVSSGPASQLVARRSVRQLPHGSTPAEFCQGWLTAVRRDLDRTLVATLAVRLPGTPGLAELARWQCAGRDTEVLTAVRDLALREGRPVLLPVPLTSGPGVGVPTEASSAAVLSIVHAVAVPLVTNKEVGAVVAVLLDRTNPADCEGVAERLSWDLAWIEVLLCRAAAEQELRNRDGHEFGLTLAGIFLEHDRAADAATACATELASRLGADRVAVGRQRGKAIQLLALSHTPEVKNDTALAQGLMTAMEEALDEARTITYESDAAQTTSQSNANTPLVPLSHERLARLHGSSAVVSVPLVAGRRAVGAVVCEWGRLPSDFERAKRRAEAAAALLGPLLEQRLAAERSLLHHTGHVLHGGASRLVGPGHPILKSVALLGAALLIVGILMPATWWISAPATLEGAAQRVVAAPVQGFVKSVHAAPGDRVHTGQVLARMDEGTLQVELERNQSQQQELLRQQRAADADHDRAHWMILAAQLGQLQAQQVLLTTQLDRLTVKAPVDGVIVKGDLRQLVGSPVEQGQTLFEVAPLTAFRAILEVEDRDIGGIRVGQSGRLRIAGLPGQTYSVEVVRISPVNDAKNGRNDFRVEAALPQASQELRPGMTGVGRLDAGQHSLLWTWAHSLYDRARLWLWSVWP